MYCSGDSRDGLVVFLRKGQDREAFGSKKSNMLKKIKKEMRIDTVL